MSEIDKRWADYLSNEWIESLDGTPFLKKCRSGSVSLEELRRFLVQQYFYSRHFTRYLCALLANVVDEEDRRRLTENLIDEIGLGSQKGVPHSVLYRQMMEKLGLNAEHAKSSEATELLVQTMLESCRNPNLAVGLGALCLGAEAIVPHIYAQVVKGFESKGFTREELEFFYLHMECDDDHALTMKVIMDRQILNPANQQMMQSSAARMVAMRRRFFESISPQSNQCEKGVA